MLMIQVDFGLSVYASMGVQDFGLEAKWKDALFSTKMEQALQELGEEEVKPRMPEEVSVSR